MHSVKRMSRGYRVLFPEPPQITTSLRVHPISTAHTPDVEAVALNADAQVTGAGEEEHGPRVAGTDGVGSSRPVVGRLHGRENATRNIGSCR